MAINKYMTELGLLHIVQDSNIYAFANALSTNQVILYDGSNLTAAGIEAKNMLHFNEFYPTVFKKTSTAEIRSVLNGVMLLFENAVISDKNDAMSDVPISISGAPDTKKLLTTCSISGNFIVGLSSLLYSGGATIYATSMGWPFLSRYSSDDNYISYFKYGTIYVFNDDYSNGVRINISSSARNNIAINKSNNVEPVICTAFKNFFSDIIPYDPHADPYQGAGDSTTGGGDGTFDGSSDPVPVPNLPTVGAQDSGFITLFTPTASQMKDLAHYMWVNPLFDIETGFKKLFADPMDCILGLSVVPVTIPTSGAKSVNIGNLVTSVTMNVALQQYIEVDCGTVTMDRFFGSYLDYEPYTKISLFLPYCGTHSLSMDDIAGKTIGIVYHIDILTGSCIAFVKCGDSVLYEFNGACGSNIPVNSLNFASTIENAIRIAVNIGTTVATAGASAPAQTATEIARQKAMNTARNISLAGSTAEGALSLKPNVSRSGALGGGVGILGHQIPYFIITRPRLCKPAKQDFFQGYPSFIQTTIGDLIGKGFTSFTNVIISGQYLTDEEETELESILESGVYL